MEQLNIKSTNRINMPKMYIFRQFISVIFIKRIKNIKYVIDYSQYIVNNLYIYIINNIYIYIIYTLYILNYIYLYIYIYNKYS